MGYTDHYYSKTLNKETNSEVMESYSEFLDSYDLVNDLAFFDGVFGSFTENRSLKENQLKGSLNPSKVLENEEELFQREMLDSFGEIDLEKLISEKPEAMHYSKQQEKSSLNQFSSCENEKELFEVDLNFLDENIPASFQVNEVNQREISNDLTSHEMKKKVFANQEMISSPKRPDFFESFTDDFLEFEKTQGNGCKRKITLNHFNDLNAKKPKLNENVKLSQRERNRREKLEHLKIILNAKSKEALTEETLLSQSMKRYFKYKEWKATCQNNIRLSEKKEKFIKKDKNAPKKVKESVHYLPQEKTLFTFIHDDMVKDSPLMKEVAFVFSLCNVMSKRSPRASEAYMKKIWKFKSWKNHLLEQERQKNF